MAAATLYLHIGLPKTATTFLQREYFPGLPHLRYLGTPQGDILRSAEDRGHGRRTLTGCVKRAPLIWDRFGDAIFADLLGHERGRGPGDVLISDEGIGRAGSRPGLLREHLEGLVRTAERWGFERVRVLCAVRRQDHWMASHYAQISDRNPGASQADFEANVREKLDPGGSRYSIGVLLEYGELVDQLARAVGDSDLLVLPYELLVADPVAFHARLDTFLGAPPGRTAPGPDDDARRNVRSSGSESWTLRSAPRTRVVGLRPFRVLTALGLPTELHLVDRGREPGTIWLTPALTRAVLEEYEPANRRLAERLELDLGRFGYFPDR